MVFLRKQLRLGGDTSGWFFPWSVPWAWVGAEFLRVPQRVLDLHVSSGGRDLDPFCRLLLFFLLSPPPMYPRGMSSRRGGGRGVASLILIVTCPIVSFVTSS